MKKRLVSFAFLPFLLFSCGGEDIPSSSSISSSERSFSPAEASAYDEEAVELMYRLHSFPFGEGETSLLDGKDPSELEAALPAVEAGSFVPTYFGYSYPYYPRLKLLQADVAEMEMPDEAAFLFPCFAGKRLELVFQIYSAYTYYPGGGKEPFDAGLVYDAARIMMVSITDGESILFLSELSASKRLVQEAMIYRDLYLSATVSTGGLFALLNEPLALASELVATIGIGDESQNPVPSLSITEFFLFLYQADGYAKIEIPSLAVKLDGGRTLSSNVGASIDLKEGRA